MATGNSKPSRTLNVMRIRRGPKAETPEGPLVRDAARLAISIPNGTFASGAYRQHWCRVRERFMEEGTSDFYTETLAEHRPLVAQVINRFEHFLPELFRKVTRRYDGEDIELDGVIERFVDRRAGSAADGENLLAARAHTARRGGGGAARHERDDQRVRRSWKPLKRTVPAGPSAQAYSDYLRGLPPASISAASHCAGAPSN